MMMSSFQKFGDAALLFARLAIGAIFIYHGYSKWQMEDPSTIMTILKFAEPLGGAALILGVLTRLAAIGLSVIMLGAIYMKASGFGQGTLDLAGTFADGGKWEFDLAVLASCLMLVAMGSGKIAIDSVLSKK